MRRRGEIGSLLLFCAVTLVAAALLVRPFRAKREAFDKASFARLQQRQPEFVLIGDSLLGYSIDQATLESALDGRHVEVLWHGGAASAAWFLYLKNFVNGAGLHPRRVFIFVHDDVLTNPRFRTTGKYLQALQRLMTKNEPVLEQLAGVEKEKWWLQRWIAVLFSADENRAHYQEKVDARVRRLIAIKSDSARQLERDANAIFDIPKLRSDQPIVTSEGHKPFGQAVGESFLPHILALARAGHYPLSFVRPRKRPGPYADYDTREEMRAYYADLQAYLEADGCELIDLTRDPAITPDMFADSVHIGPWATVRFTRHFEEELAGRFR
ncbi:MAG: hypothetical protein ACJ8KU_08570 [Chthoniobacterales bacterium]